MKSNSHSSRPWCNKRHTLGYYCTHRPQTTQHWGPHSFSVQGEGVSTHCMWVLLLLLLSSSGEKHIQGKLVCDLTCLDMKSEHKLTSPLPSFFLLFKIFLSVNNVQSYRVVVETEENPAQQMAWRRSMLQFAAQSFTYTDNLNKQEVESTKERKLFLPEKVGFRLLHKQPSEEKFCSMLPTLWHFTSQQHWNPESERWIDEVCVLIRWEKSVHNAHEADLKRDARKSPPQLWCIQGVWFLTVSQLWKRFWSSFKLKLNI